ncbi:MAG: von Willebrand factor type A domain-containing protein, partial [Hyphomicrobiaceae bacterium]
MTERNLKTLRNMNVPRPRPEAKATALQEALAAYDHKFSAVPPQGIGTEARPTHVPPNSTGRRQMRAMKSNFAIAASIAVAAVSVPLALHFLQTEIISQQQKRPNETVVGVLSSSPPSGVDNSVSGILTTVPPRKPERRSRSTLASLRPAQSPHMVSSGERTKALKGRLYGASPKISQYRSAIRARRDVQVAANQAEPRRRETDMSFPPRQNRDRFPATSNSEIKTVAVEPVSTFSVDVDTASYSFVRRSLLAGRLPPKAAVRVEEMLNYFHYDYARPEQMSHPFKSTVTLVPSPWNPDNQLLHIGIKGYELNSAQRPDANLVLLVDVSGSM